MDDEAASISKSMRPLPFSVAYLTSNVGSFCVSDLITFNQILTDDYCGVQIKMYNQVTIVSESLDTAIS